MGLSASRSYEFKHSRRVGTETLSVKDFRLDGEWQELIAGKNILFVGDDDEADTFTKILLEKVGFKRQFVIHHPNKSDMYGDKNHTEYNDLVISSLKYNMKKYPNHPKMLLIDGVQDYNNNYDHDILKIFRKHNYSIFVKGYDLADIEDDILHEIDYIFIFGDNKPHDLQFASPSSGGLEGEEGLKGTEETEGLKGTEEIETNDEEGTEGEEGPEDLEGPEGVDWGSVFGSCEGGEIVCVDNNTRDIFYLVYE